MSTQNWSDWDRCPPGAALTEADPEIAALVGEEIARLDKIPTYQAADRVAERRITAVRAMVKTWPQWPNKAG